MQPDYFIRRLTGHRSYRGRQAYLRQIPACQAQVQQQQPTAGQGCCSDFTAAASIRPTIDLMFYVSRFTVEREGVPDGKVA